LAKKRASNWNTLAVEDLPPLPASEERRTGVDIRDYLRRLILDGRIAPDTELSQVHVARALGVSRTPVREALQMLGKDGLVTAEPNHRARVKAFDPAELDALYAHRVLMESLALATSIDAFRPRDIDELSEILDQMEAGFADGEQAQWMRLHREFHRLMVSGTTTSMQELVNARADQTDRYQYLRLKSDPPTPRSRGAREHRALVAACRDRDRPGAVRLLATHLAQTAFELGRVLAPAYPLAATQRALSFVDAAAEELGPSVRSAVKAAAGKG